MQRRQLALERNGPSRVEVTWEGAGEDARVFVDGALAHHFASPKEFIRGAILPLPDGSELRVRLRPAIGLDVRRNGVALPGSETDPAFVLNGAASWMFWMGGIGLAVEIEHLLRSTTDGARWIFGIEALGDVVFLGLAFLTKRGARWALGVAVVMTLITAVISWQAGRGIVSTVWNVLIFALLAQRFSASADNPRGSTGPLTSEPLPPATPRRRRPRDAYSWPSRFDDDDVPPPS